MSGPALKHVDSHSAIHEAALTEARELTDLLAQLLVEQEQEKAIKVAFIVVEHWETRTLQHAQAEEEGLYKEIVRESPELQSAIIKLTRDHDLLRNLVQEIKDLLDQNGVTEAVLQRFQALIIVDELHNQEEMRVLPGHGEEDHA